MVFSSIFKNEFKNFLEIIKSTKARNTYLHYRNSLQEFDLYLSSIEYKDKKLNREIIDCWIATIKGKPSTVQGKVVHIKYFLRYLNEIDIYAEMPDLPIFRSDYIAYQFSDDEIEKIYEYIDNLKDHYRVLTSNRNLFYEMPVIFRILLCCGTRLGETLALKVGDIDFSTDCILIVNNTKRKKQRIVPMNHNLAEIIKKYCIRMGIIENPYHLLFPSSKNDEKINDNKKISSPFHTILKRLGIYDKAPNSSENAIHERGPCIHCLRHAFAFRALKQNEEIHSMDVMVPYLSIYLGHERLDETEKYLKYSPDLRLDVTKLFEDYSSSLFPGVLP